MRANIVIGGRCTLLRVLSYKTRDHSFFILIIYQYRGNGYKY